MNSSTIFKSLSFALALSAAACASTEAPKAAEQGARAPVQQAKAEQANPNIDALNKLTAISIDASALYKEAAGISDKAALKSELTYLSVQREKLTKILQSKIVAMGGVPAQDGQMLGVGHRTCTAMRNVFENIEKVAASEVLRGEQYLVDEMMKVEGSADVNAMTKSDVKALLPGVVADRDRVKQLAKKFGADP